MRRCSASSSIRSKRARRHWSTPSTITTATARGSAGSCAAKRTSWKSVASFNEQIEKIKDEFGFHFDTPDYKLVHETDCFLMYQVLPLKKGVAVRDDVRPMLLVPPYMLGVHILSFLPHENKSYAHSFANEGIPTYVRVVKDIMKTEAVQRTTSEDDCLQTLELCNKIKEIHGKKVVLNGSCQGGYICLMNILSGKLTEVCDTLITNVTPIDGTYSDAISGMPQMHSDFDRLGIGHVVLLALDVRFDGLRRHRPQKIAGPHCAELGPSHRRRAPGTHS